MKSAFTTLLAVTLSGLAFFSPAAINAASPAPDSAEAKKERLEWFRHDKYGLFIHWGLYAISAGYWKGERSNGIGEWVMSRMRVPVREYEQLTKQFNPTKFDADAWAQLAVDSGMKYVVITAKHHDGFALFKSAVSPYNVVDATPFKRDIIKELATACARHGLRFGVYYSQSQDWHEPNGAGNDWDFPPNEKKDFDQYLQSKAEPQVRELLTNYGPICLIWFDTPVMMRDATESERGARFARMIRELQPSTLIDGRLGIAGDYRSTSDNVIPAQGDDEAWEVPATINQTWGYRTDDHNWKSPGQVLFNLVDIVSKGGNYLLNIGPMADGIIPQPSQDTLRAVGQWLKVNGEAIYGAQRSPFGGEFGEHAQALKDREGKPVFLPYARWRCTTKPGKLYFTLFSVERDDQLGYFALPAFKNPIKSVYMLDDAKHTAIPVKTAADGTRFVNPSRYVNDNIGSVLVVEIEGDKVAL